MTSRPALACSRVGASLPALSPLVLAILAAFPVMAGAQVARPAVPAPATVPIPSRVGWLVSTSAPNLPTPVPVATPNAAGGTSLTINQLSPGAVYSWQSFDIGAASSVTFNYPSATSSSLNRVTGSTSPSAIYGALRSQYANPDPNGAPLVGGSIYLVNANGILFGRTAQVDTGALIASTLDLQNADFYAGLSQSIASQGYSFGPFAAVGDTPASLLPGANNFVLVDPGARITTPSGGRVFLFANNTVQNGGTITTPNGQTALAAGDQVYLNVPTNEPMYASEVNSAIPAVNGLLVEVGTGNGSVANLQGGVINTPTGNTTLVGMAVNQSGRINATTSVTQDGSVFLLARGNAQIAFSSQGHLTLKEATTAGALTLGPGSVIDIEPDTAVDAKGNQATSNANSSFTPSLVQLSGLTVDLQAGSAIVAHGGVVDVRAEHSPYYVSDADTPPRTYDYGAMTGDDARLVVDANATIDVSGTTSTTVSAARNFVTTALLGANDLADAPLQRTGPVYRSELTFDVRSPVPILGNTSAYVNAIEKTATEQLATGGKIKLASTGAVVTNAASTLDVSGGQVNYTTATVTPSQLLGSDGKLYTFNQAPAGLSYTGVVGAPTGQLDRWGVVPSFTPSQVSRGVVAPGYVAGQAGGTLSVVSPVAVLDGQIDATVTQGARQTAGQDPLAAPSRLVLGARANGSNAFGSAGFTSAGLADLDITMAPGTLGSAFWNDPLAGVLPTTSRIAASTLNASGLGRIQVTADDGITLDAGADLKLPTSAVVDLAAGGAGGIALDADIRAAGGNVSAQTRSIDGQGAAGGLTLAAGSTIDVSATWVNRALDGPTAMASTAGGSVSLSSGGALDVQDASRIDVSGAATVGTNGKVAATAAGSVTLQSGMSVPDGGVAAPVHLGADLVAGSLAGGGTLTINADAVTIGAGAIPGGVADGPAAGSLVLSNAFFNQGAFTNYAVNAVSSLVVTSGTTIAPGVDNWLIGPDAATRPTGTLPSSFMATGRLPVGQRAAASVQLDAKALQGSVAGDVTLASGSSIVVDPLASVTLDAGRNLTDGGRIVAPGGNVALNMVGNAVTPPDALLKVGSGAVIDVSGTVLPSPQTGALPTGQVLAGGNVTLAVASGNTNTAIVVAPGAVIAADGATGTLGVATTNAAGNVGVSSQTVASAGGSITVAVGPSHVAGAALAGDLHAHGGDATVAGGSFNLTGADTIVVQQAPVTDTAPVAGLSAVTVSAQSLGRGFTNVDLQASQQVRFITDTTLALGGNLQVDAPALVLAPGANQVALSGASMLQVGASYQQIPSTAGAIGGAGRLSLSGGLVELSGHQVLQGVGSVNVAAGNELRLQSLDGANGVQGTLGVQGDVVLSAPQVAPTSASQYVLDAPGQHVTITGGDRGAPLPMSAGGNLTINAADIAIGSATDASQAGVLRAPFGSITLNASDSLVVGSGSLLSVAGTGLTLPYGQTSGGANWTYGGAPVVAPPAKSISLNAPGGAIDVAAGSTLDLSGGGNLVAQEFVPGNGGTKNIFAGAAGGAFAVVPTAGLYAAQDADILLHQPDANGVHPTLQLGRTVTFGSGGPIPAGTYAVMPAQYATLAGAFLVTPTASNAPLALGAAVRQTDGSVLVGGRLGQAGTSFTGAPPQSFKVMTSAQALAYSEIDQADANTYFAAQATAKGQPVPSLPTDAGVLAIAAGQLNLKGDTLFALPTVTTGSGSTATTSTVGRGGELDIAANAIQVGGTAAPDVLVLDPSDIDGTGASLVVLGGLKDASTGHVAVSAANVTIAGTGTPLKVNDLVLVATDAVTVQAGSTIAAPAASSSGTPVAAPTLRLDGDGALLRVSTDASATSVRTGVQGTAGQLDIGAGATLSGGALTLEGTRSNAIAGDAVLRADAITLGAGHLAVGDLGATVPSADTLVLTPALAAQLAGAKSLTLRAATGLDLYDHAQLGSASVRSLTLDTASLALVGDAATATISAGGVTLQNTTGRTAIASTGGNALVVQALGTDTATGGGQVVIGPGSVAVGGAGAVTLAAAHEVVLADHGALATGGDLTISAASLQATREAQAELDAGGRFTLAATGTASTAAPGAGAQVSIAAASIEQQGSIVLPSGQLSLQATAGGDAVHFAAGSRTDLSGRASQMDGITVTTPGGTLSALASAGNVQVDIGSAIDVSAPAAGGHAGSVTISAPSGSVALQGSLRGTAAAGQGGGALDIDSGTALDLAALAATINAAQDNFGARIAVRNRSGDQTLAAGTTLAAQSLSISADSGILAIAGRLDASGASGTRIVLAGGDGVDIEAGAAIGAHSTGGTGAQVALLGGGHVLQADGTFSGSGGSVAFDGGTIDTSGTAGGSAGTLLVRALRGADGTGVAIGGSGSGTAVTGASQVQVESVQQYAATTVDNALIAKVNADNQVLGTTAGATLARVAALVGQPVSSLQLRSGVEIDSTGDLSVTGNAAAGGWNLTSFAANGSAQAQASGAPMDLTLRAAGNLVVSASISDGFLPTGNVPTTAAAAARIMPSAVVAQVNGAYAQGANITLVGGADLAAADVMRTQASADAGDVTIGAAGKNVLVRSTTGNIAIAAGRDVTLLNAQADVYTTGTPVTAQQLQAQGYVGNLLPGVAYLRSGTASQSPFLASGGSVRVTAARDIVGADPDAATLQTANAWTWRASDQKVNGQPMWWSRYDLFQQGFASFGGGNVSAVAGQDLVNANFSSATSGFVARNADGKAGASVSYGGGDVDVAAGRDIVGGGVMATGNVGVVRAGRDIAASPSLSSPFALQVLYGNTALDIGALDNVRLGLVSPFGLTPPTNEYLPATAAANYMTIMGLTPRATLDVLAGAGDVNYDASSPMDVSQSPNAPLIVADRIVPDTTRFAAPGGSITAGTLVQIPAGTTKLSLLANDSLTVSGISVGGTDPRAATPTLLVGAEPIAEPLFDKTPGQTPYDSGARSPMELVAQDGDVTVTQGIRTTTPLRMIAGRDILLAPTTADIYGGMTIQHQDAGELSLVQAGRDIVFPDPISGLEGGLQFYGPGNLVVFAGRNIDLSNSRGVLALGNRQNAVLPSLSGNVTMAAGVSLSGGDYTQAAAWYFPLLGGTGVSAFAPDLFAQLTAVKAGQALPALGGSVAQQFAKASIADQVAQVKALVGEEAFDAAVLADAQRRAGGTGPGPGTSFDATQAQAAFDNLGTGPQGTADQGKVIAAVLSNAWTATLPAAQQQAQALAMAQAAKSPYLARLQQFVASQGGPANADAATALAAYEAMAPERQALFTNLVLVDVIRTSGRAASKLSGDAQKAAYQPAYDALDVVFPAAGGESHIAMGTSQVETLQDSDITLLAPRGSVDVGTVAASANPKPANALGVVTAAGGNVSMVVGDSVNVDQSRVFTVGLGDLLMWASNGSLDAGRGGKTVVGAPAPVYRLDPQTGQFSVDLSGSFSGSGIAVLNADSNLDLYAPKGQINAGDAGIKSLGNAYFGAAQFVGTDNLSVGGLSVGAPPAASTGGGTAGLAAVAQSATSATAVNAGDSEEEKERKRRKRLNLVLDFLGFGDGAAKP
jgi:filamentous hemagglutinin family protein